MSTDPSPWETPVPTPAPPPVPTLPQAWAPGSRTGVVPVAAVATVPVPAGLWVVGAHGGAGTTTLARLLGAGDAGRTWPTGPGVRVWVAARTHATGIEAARQGAITWAGGGAGNATLAGVLWVPDGPARLPKALREPVELASGAFPAAVTVPWVPEWRQSLTPWGNPPRSVIRALAGIS